jgi:hypothetical protein
MKRVSTTAVAQLVQSINLKLWLFIAVGPGELAACAVGFLLHGYLLQVTVCCAF